MRNFIKYIFRILGLRNLFQNLSLELKTKKNLKNSNIDKKMFDDVLKKQSEIKKQYFRHKIYPKLSLVMTSYNHVNNAEEMHKAMRKTKADEIIVCDDGSIDGSNEKWRKLLNRPNEYLISSNENHEFMCLDRAYLSTRAEIICLMQDDDIPPMDDEWTRNALRLFELYPDLVMIGCNGGNVIDREENKFENYNSYGYSKKLRELSNVNRENKIKEIQIGNKSENIKFMFIHAVNYGPCFIRKNFYLESGGYNLEHIGIGNIAIFMDWEFSLRAWKSGKLVALYEAEGFKRRTGGSRQQVFQLKNRITQSNKNKKYLEDHYNFNLIKEIGNKINNLNQKLDKY